MKCPSRSECQQPLTQKLFVVQLMFYFAKLVKNSQTKYICVALDGDKFNPNGEVSGGNKINITTHMRDEFTINLFDSKELQSKRVASLHKFKPTYLKKQPLIKRKKS